MGQAGTAWSVRTGLKAACPKNTLPHCDEESNPMGVTRSIVKEKQPFEEKGGVVTVMRTNWSEKDAVLSRTKSRYGAAESGLPSSHRLAVHRCQTDTRTHAPQGKVEADRLSLHASAM